MLAIESFLTAKNIDIKKAMFVGFDGCNTMSGENKDLQRRFRHIVPHQIYINCRNHKLAFCIKHLIKEFPIVADVDSVMLAIWKLFYYSPQRFSVFKEIQETYNMTVLSLIRAASTRWLSHGKACLRLIDRYTQVLDALDMVYDRKREPEVFGVREMLTNKTTVATILLICDILKPVIRFSAYLQGDVFFTDVNSKMKALVDELHHTVEKLQNFVTLDEEQQRQFQGLHFARIYTFLQEIDDRTMLARRLRERNQFTVHRYIEEVGIPLVYSLVNEIEDAFHCCPVLTGFAAFDLTKFPNSAAELEEYGKEYIHALASHYGNVKEDLYQGHKEVANPVYSEHVIISEYIHFKFQMHLMRQREPEGNINLFQKLATDEVLRGSFPAMYFLLYLSQIIPSSTACVERIFSLMNSLCTPQRNRLSQSTLDSLMRICSYKSAMDMIITPPQMEGMINAFRNMHTRKIVL